jgi:intracellular septation protein
MDDKGKAKAKLALEYGPILAFFAGYLALKDRMFTLGGTEYSGFIVMTALFVPMLLASTLALWRLTGSLSRMQVFTLVIVVVFGALSVVFNDERFFKMKVTIIYGLFALGLGIGLARGQSYLAALMGGALPLRPEGWMILTRRIALFFLALAVANEVIWRNFSTETWVSFKTFGLTAALFAFFMAQGKLLSQYGMDEGQDG